MQCNAVASSVFCKFRILSRCALALGLKPRFTCGTLGLPKDLLPYTSLLRFRYRAWACLTKFCPCEFWGCRHERHAGFGALRWMSSCESPKSQTPRWTKLPRSDPRKLPNMRGLLLLLLAGLPCLLAPPGSQLDSGKRVLQGFRPKGPGTISGRPKAFSR